MECCIEKIRRWLIQDRLLLNDNKTEFIIIGTRQQLNKLQAMNIKVGGSVIKPSCQVKNLGSWLDPNLNMRHHIAKISVTSPIVINMPTRELLAVKTKSSFVSRFAHLNNKNNVCKQIPSLLQMYVRPAFSTCIILGALRSIY